MGRPASRCALYGGFLGPLQSQVKLYVVEIQTIVVAIQVIPVEIQVNVVELHLNSVEIQVEIQLAFLKNTTYIFVTLTCISTVITGISDNTLLSSCHVEPSRKTRHVL